MNGLRDGPPVVVHDGSRDRRNLKDVVADHVRDLIFSGQLRPGEKIDQDELVASLGVSKPPIREALILLEGEALVQNVAHRGAFVGALTRADVRDHYALYGLVSGLAAERAAQRLRAADLQELRELLELMGVTRSPAELQGLNHRFHRIINRAGASQRLLSVIRLLARGIPSRFYELTAGWGEVAHEHHHCILVALAARDGPAAGRTMRDHLVASGELAVARIEEQGFWTRAAADEAEAAGEDPAVANRKDSR